MKRQRISHLRKRPGAAAVEMAVIAPVLFTMVFGICEIAFGYMVHHEMQDAARQGCRVAICSGQSNTAVLAKINGLLQSDKVSSATTKITVNNTVADVSTANFGDSITVQISVPASKVTFFPVSGYLKGTLTAICSMRHE
jgi:Flp pilus assembly protein TadG